MTTKALFITAKGGALLPYGPKLVFTAAASDICTAVAHGLQTGAGPYKVMNNVADAPAGLTEAVHSSATLTATNPVATDVVTIAGKAYTFIATPAADGDVDVGAATTVGTARSMVNLAAAINRDILAAASTYDLDTALNDTVKAVITEVAATTILRIVAKTLDATIGDAITLTSDDATIVASAAVLGSGQYGYHRRSGDGRSAPWVAYGDWRKGISGGAQHCQVLAGADRRFGARRHLVTVGITATKHT